MNAHPETTPPTADERRQMRLRNFVVAQRLSPPEQIELADDFDPGPLYDDAPVQGRDRT